MKHFNQILKYIDFKFKYVSAEFFAIFVGRNLVLSDANEMDPIFHHLAVKPFLLIRKHQQVLVHFPKI